MAAIFDRTRPTPFTTNTCTYSWYIFGQNIPHKFKGKTKSTEGGRDKGYQCRRIFVSDSLRLLTEFVSGPSSGAKKKTRACYIHVRIQRDCCFDCFLKTPRDLIHKELRALRSKSKSRRPACAPLAPPCFGTPHLNLSTTPNSSGFFACSFDKGNISVTCSSEE